MPSHRIAPRVYVEGRDDKFAILHLVRRHGLTEHTSQNFPEIKDVEGKSGVLAAIEAAVSAGTDRTLAFVLDADGSVADTWRAVATRLKRVEVPVPDQIPNVGFVNVSNRFRTLTGVWIMPDNLRAGKLEDFSRISLMKVTSCFRTLAKQHDAPSRAEQLFLTKKPARPCSTHGSLGRRSRVDRMGGRLGMDIFATIAKPPYVSWHGSVGSSPTRSLSARGSETTRLDVRPSGRCGVGGRRGWCRAPAPRWSRGRGRGRGGSRAVVSAPATGWTP